MNYNVEINNPMPTNIQAKTRAEAWEQLDDWLNNCISLVETCDKCNKRLTTDIDDQLYCNNKKCPEYNKRIGTW